MSFKFKPENLEQENARLKEKLYQANQKIQLLAAVLRIFQSDLCVKSERLETLCENLRHNPIWQECMDELESKQFQSVNRGQEDTALAGNSNIVTTSSLHNSLKSPRMNETSSDAFAKNGTKSQKESEDQKINTSNTRTTYPFYDDMFRIPSHTTNANSQQYEHCVQLH
ncbi:hypothetical protein RFI_10446 [Reticulomyxa filosa]|uniref:Uncharacterized protein n=1 Tax=Reticulomyxa filosa TaxID=46433 RepID=X6NMQ8_RETFI|nr:hypothetical protein RFI_10446 [Reticulomyxa filosa]|eukprot:ETO26687.1 hypothetical protein RFI_10446 [Reticulomyxa filosa]